MSSGKWEFSLALMSLIIALSGCSGSGAEFEGLWVSHAKSIWRGSESPDEIMALVIRKDGDRLSIKEVGPNANGPQWVAAVSGADLIIAEGNLALTGGINETTGNLVFLGQAWEKSSTDRYATLVALEYARRQLHIEASRVCAMWRSGNPHCIDEKELFAQLDQGISIAEGFSGARKLIAQFELAEIVQANDAMRRKAVEAVDLKNKNILEQRLKELKILPTSERSKTKELSTRLKSTPVAETIKSGKLVAGAGFP